MDIVTCSLIICWNNSPWPETRTLHMNLTRSFIHLLNSFSNQCVETIIHELKQERYTWAELNKNATHESNSLLRLGLGEGWSLPLRIRVSRYPPQFILRLCLGEGWSLPLRIRISAYPLPSILRLCLGEGWSSSLRIRVSTLFRGVSLKWQGILQLLPGKLE